jgi:triosephosphate isomerase (TIM)
MRKPFVCGNWKLNHLLSVSTELIGQIIEGMPKNDETDVVVAPVATVLFSASAKAKGSLLKIAAQNVFYENHGAFTGEWSVQHLLELGCRYSIVGHSERRQYFHETNESVFKKTKACFAHGLIPIVCIGESMEQKEQGKTQSVLQEQLTSVLDVLTEENMPEFILAYEPVWAIGTGKSALASEAENVHSYLRGLLADRFGYLAAEKARIIYGGSVKAENAKELMSQKNVDGFLIGGASLTAASFLAIVKNI